MDNIQAAILNVKIRYLPEALKKRKQIAEEYKWELKAVNIETPVLQEGRVWQDFIIRTNKRDKLYDFLKKNGIETMKNEYPFPIPKIPKSIQYEKETLRLPIYPGLTVEEVLYVIKKIKEFIE